jgi:hypothetical protein
MSRMEFLSLIKKVRRKRHDLKQVCLDIDNGCIFESRDDIVSGFGRKEFMKSLKSANVFGRSRKPDCELSIDFGKDDFCKGHSVNDMIINWPGSKKVLNL